MADHIAAQGRALAYGLSKTWRDALTRGYVKSTRTADRMGRAGLVLQFSQWSEGDWARLDKLSPLGEAVKSALGGDAP